MAYQRVKWEDGTDYLFNIAHYFEEHGKIWSTVLYEVSLVIPTVVFRTSL